MKLFNFLKKQQKHNVLVFGPNGMLGSEVLNTFKKSDIIEKVVPCYTDISNFSQLMTDIECYEEIYNCKFDYIVNCAALTDTTLCENDQYGSFVVNALGAQILANVCHKLKKHLIHISTDYVFSENSCKFSNEKFEYKSEFPVNIYGTHKLLAEKFIKDEFGCDDNWTIFRTSWLYGKTKKPKTFIHKFIKSCLENSTVNVTSDAFGKPTSCKFLAEMILCSIENNLHGLMDGQYIGKTISRYEYAMKIFDIWNDLSKEKENGKSIENVKIVSVLSSAFKTAIKHPLHLSCISKKYNMIETFPCEIGLKKYLKKFENFDEDYAFSELYDYISSNYDDILKSLN